MHTTCFINPIHYVPTDLWRYTPDALRWLHRDYQAVIACGGWGNQDVWEVVRDGIRFLGVPEVRWHPLNRIATKNDPLWPVVTWIAARK